LFVGSGGRESVNDAEALVLAVLRAAVLVAQLALVERVADALEAARRAEIALAFDAIERALGGRGRGRLLRSAHDRRDTVHVGGVRVPLHFH